MLGSAWRAVNGNGAVDKGKGPERPSEPAGLPRLIPLFDTHDAERPAGATAALTDDDLAGLGKTTREAMEARLRLLERVDADIARTMDDVRRALREFGGSSTTHEGSVDTP